MLFFDTLAVMQEFILGILMAIAALFGGSGGASAEDEAPQTQTNLINATGMVVQIVDGDTIDVLIEEKQERVRYIGIDTPELRIQTNEKPDCFAKEATAANSRLVAGNEVLLVADVDDRDDYGRLLRYVYVGNTFVNEELLKDGYAKLLFIPPNTKEYNHFKTIRDEARSKRKGLWAACAN